MLRLDRRCGDHFNFFVTASGRVETVLRDRPGEINPQKLTISDGICDACRAKLFSEPGL